MSTGSEVGDITADRTGIFSEPYYGTALNYLYSFDNGLYCLEDLCEAAAYSPSSPK